MSRKYIFVYKTVNKINNKFYIGVHTTNNLDDGYIGCGIDRSNSHPRKHYKFHKAVRKYGYNNFEREILQFFNTEDDAFKYEQQIVTEQLIKDPNCYNTRIGGKGGRWTEEMKQRHMVNNTFKKSDETRKKLSDAAKHRFKTSPGTFKGKHHTEETRKKLHDLNVGKVISDNQKQQISATLIRNTILRHEKMLKDAEYMSSVKSKHKQSALNNSGIRSISPELIEKLKSEYTGKRGNFAYLNKTYNVGYGILASLFGNQYKFNAISANICNQIKEAYKNGSTIKQILQQFNISEYICRQILRGKYKSTDDILPCEILRQVQYDYDTGNYINLHTLAKKYNISYNILMRFLKRNKREVAISNT